MIKSLLIVFSAFTLYSCKEDITPSWLEIPAMNLTTDEPVEGSNSHSIDDAWVFMDGKAIGVFELPAKIPILDEGEHTFIIYAGIRENGINYYRVKYPFYERYETTLTLVKGETISVTPQITYKNNLRFEMIEDFEAPGMYLEDAFNSQATLVFLTASEAPDTVKYGFRCGAIHLTETDSMYKGVTSQFLDLPKNEDVYLEIDYMNNNSMVMSSIAQNSVDFVEEPPYAQFNPMKANENLKWKKMYIPLIENISFHTTATSYEVYFLALLDPEKTTGFIYIDNIKIICYE
jgi:hypothetical protein